ncbi:putative ACR, COG2135 family protein [Trichomonas vaginalis G3]|uniref:Uncharacterized ACR, COG2135 family protein n=1 Tax=Trichomonas vaginalis (strain ATCC PRA-98 / G3) TaxID=412133 RepID=A2DGN7_TRIV3|nr:uncharacterized protein TVAGG3_0997700 [Trichomonas vaginalis G3]EAY20424.1 putative ACR, COG2135 family protein [Trichomonas vaginalis G3]KAI5490526.1 SOS response-associated peptidase family [Trichomonas vaginalis G3]|eukprot:XP_001581410.1 hypothetical protein [Trichomonas vaginalis G3]
MCGRFALNRALTQLLANVNARRIQENGFQFNPSNNISPTNPAPILANQIIQLLKWGIQTGSQPLINARSETVVEKFNKDIMTRRCVIPADGYFEWNKQSQPYFFHKRNNELLFLAGFYTQHNEFVILTRDSVNDIKKVHPRMPIILSQDEIALWESPKFEYFLKCNPPQIYFYPVSREALRPGYTGADCVKPINGSKQQLTMMDMFKSVKKDKPDLKTMLVKA